MSTSSSQKSPLMSDTRENDADSRQGKRASSRRSQNSVQRAVNAEASVDEWLERNFPGEKIMNFDRNLVLQQSIF